MESEDAKQVTFETFKLHDSRTIRKLSVNQHGYENSPHSYLVFMLKLLQLNRIMTQRELEAELLEHFGPSMGPDDKRLMKAGKFGRVPKWKNSLAWAKVVARKQRLICWRSRQREGVTQTFIVLTAWDKEHRDFINWASHRKAPRMKRIRIRRRPAIRKHKLVLG